MDIELTEFAKRQLNPDYKGTVVNKEDVEKLILLAANEGITSDGYASFNKIISIKNISDDGSYRFNYLKSLVIDKGNARTLGALFRTAYEARRHDELSVLVEWVEGITPPIAKWIQLIIYSKKQMLKEEEHINSAWGIVGISTGMVREIDPMKPATVLRNALGVEEGGSGEKICRDYYKQCVDFWQKNIMIRL